MSAEEDKKEMNFSPESKNEGGVKPPEIIERAPKKIADVLSEQAFELNKGEGIIEEQGKKDGRIFKVCDADEENTREFLEGRDAINQKAREAKNAYNEEIEKITKGDAGAEGGISENKKVNKTINNKNMESIRENIGGEREGEILNRLEEIRSEKEKLFGHKMELDGKRSKLEAWEQEEKKLNKEFNKHYDNVTEEEKTNELIISSEDAKEKRLSKEELQEMEEIVKKVAAEIGFLKISTYTREEKTESVEKQLSILDEILPKFHKDNYKELFIFREANGLKEKLLQFKKEPYLLD